MFDQISARCRAVVVFLFAALALLVFTACCYLGQDWFSKWNALPIGGALMLVSIPFHLQGAKCGISYVFSFLLNTVGMGFCASAYYTMTALPAALEDLLPAIILPLAILFISCILLTALRELKQPIVAIVMMLEISLVIASIVFFAKRGGDFYAFSLFSLLIASFYTVVYALTVDEDRAIFRDISFGSYGAFLLVGVAALVAIALAAGDGCECDGGDCCDCDCSGCDCGGGGDGKTKTKKIKK